MGGRRHKSIPARHRSIDATRSGGDLVHGQQRSLIRNAIAESPGSNPGCPFYILIGILT